MPDGTVSQELHYFDLKTLPPDGYVKLRQLPYFDMLTRRDKGSIASMEQQTTKDATPRMVLESLQTWERDYMFKNCIAEHNITDKNGNLLDFNNPMTLKMLNPKIGLEIEMYIDGLNSEGDEFAEGFPNAPSNSLEQQDQEVPEQSTSLQTTDTIQD
jgi:hypothetical protein